jgi:hypothetical protein
LTSISHIAIRVLVLSSAIQTLFIREGGGVLILMIR